MPTIDENITRFEQLLSSVQRDGIRENPFWKDVLKDISAESFILIALLHDLCKTNTYVEGTKNQKT